VDASEATVREFIARINSHDVEGIITLCAHAHRFVDGLGQVLTGYDQLRVAWSGYFNLFPDYQIDIESLYHCHSFLSKLVETLPSGVSSSSFSAIALKAASQPERGF